MGSIAYSWGPFPTRESLAARHGLTLGAMALYKEVVVNAPAAAAWAILGEQFGQIVEWAAPITASSLEGELRFGAVCTCHIARFGPVAPGAIKEHLITFDAQTRSWAYEAVEGMPGFIRRAVNRWSDGLTRASWVRFPNALKVRDAEPIRTAASPISGAVRDVPARPCRGGWYHDAPCVVHRDWAFAPGARAGASSRQGLGRAAPRAQRSADRSGTSSGVSGSPALGPGDALHQSGS